MSALLTITAAEQLARILEAPPASINPKIWLELGRVQGALKEMAGLIDRINTNPVTALGDSSYSLYHQDMIKVQVIAGEEGVGSSRAVRFESTASGIRAYQTHALNANGGHVSRTRADAFSPFNVAAGTVGTFILRGLIVYTRSDQYIAGAGFNKSGEYRAYTNVQPSEHHYRWSTYYDPYYPGKNPPKGKLCYYGAYTSNAGASSARRAYQYIGTQVGTYLGHPLIYFNPNRAVITQP